MLEINISHLCLDLKPAIIHALSSNSITFHFETNEALIKLPNETDSDKIKTILNGLKLIQNEYVIADNAENETEIVVLRMGDIEEVGLYLCSLCAMVFGSNEEKIVHERSHLFGF